MPRAWVERAVLLTGVVALIGCASALLGGGILWKVLMLLGVLCMVQAMAEHFIYN